MRLMPGHRLVRSALSGLFLLVAFGGAHIVAADPEVAVVYNSRMPESRRVAEHYAAARGIATNFIIGLDLPQTEEITRAVYRSQLEGPLLRTLESRGLWKVVSTVGAPSNSIMPGAKWRVLESRIRYLVLCYGVPLKIARDTNLFEPGQEKLKPELQRNEAAVDNELAMLPLASSGYHLTAFVQNPLYTVTNRFALHPTNGLLMVARLDGPTAEVAMQLVDRALQAERDGLWGNAYFDLRGISTGGYAKGDEWLQTAAQVSKLYGFETYVDTNAATFDTAYPMSHIALYAGWYDETVSGPFAQTNVEFMPGAFAYHLHSVNAASLRATKLWAAGLLARGATATMGSVYEPYLLGTPDIGVFFARFILLGFTFGEAAYAAMPQLSWQTTVIGDPLYKPFGQDPQQLHRHLESTQSPMLPWSHLRVVNLLLVQKQPIQDAIAYLTEVQQLCPSPVLSEKLAELDMLAGKPYSAVRALRRALELNPSPQQRIRLMLRLGALLEEVDRTSEACEVYLKFIEEHRAYPGLAQVCARALPLVRKHAPAKLAQIEALAASTTLQKLR